MGMIYQILNEAWTALRRNRTRSALTMLGIVWGIATVTLLIAYGGSFREILVSGRSRPANSPAANAPARKSSSSKPTWT